MDNKYLDVNQLLKIEDALASKKKKRYNVSDDDDDEEDDECFSNDLSDEEDDDDDDDEDESGDEEEEEVEDKSKRNNKRKRISRDAKKDAATKTNTDEGDDNDTATSVATSTRKNKSAPKRKKSNSKETAPEKKMKTNNKSNAHDKKQSRPKPKTKLEDKAKKRKNSENSKFKMDKKFYNQIVFRVKDAEEFKGEVKKRVLNGTNLDAEQINDVDYEKYLQLNFYHQKIGDMICCERPPPLKHPLVIKIFEAIIKYFCSREADKDQHKSFLNELKQVTKNDYEKIYDILLTYYYGFQSYIFYSLTQECFSKPDDPMIDFQREYIPIHQISLNKRSNQKFNIENDEKRFDLLQNLIQIVLKQINLRDEIVSNDNNILNYIVISDIKKTLNYSDVRISQHRSLAGLVFCVSFLCDVVVFGQRRLAFRRLKE